MTTNEMKSLIVYSYGSKIVMTEIVVSSEGTVEIFDLESNKEIRVEEIILDWIEAEENQQASHRYVYTSFSILASLWKNYGEDMKNIGRGNFIGAFDDLEVNFVKAETLKGFVSGMQTTIVYGKTVDVIDEVVDKNGNLLGIRIAKTIKVGGAEKKAVDCVNDLTISADTCAQQLQLESLRIYKELHGVYGDGKFVLKTRNDNRK